MKSATIEKIGLYNQILDFCRDYPQRKFNIQMEFDIEPKNLGSMLTIMIKNGLLKANKIHHHCCEYQTVKGAVYKPHIDAPVRTNDELDEARKRKFNIKVEGNVTTVKMNSYHTTAGIKPKNEWTGYSSLGV